MNFPSTWQMIAVSGGCVAGLAVIAILLIIRRTIYRAKNPQFGTTIKCSNFIAPFVAGHVQPHSSFQLESDPMSLSNKENRGLTYTTYAALHSKPRYSLSSNQSGSLEDGQKSWTVSMKLWYKREKQQLHVTVFRACCTPAPEKFKEFPSTMYIQLSVSQDPERVFQTSLYSNHGTNSIEETFKFSIPRETLDETDLKVVLIESDIDRTRLFRGRTVVELSEFHLDNGKVHYLSRDLDQIRNPSLNYWNTRSGSVCMDCNPPPIPTHQLICANNSGNSFNQSNAEGTIRRLPWISYISSAKFLQIFTLFSHSTLPRRDIIRGRWDWDAAGRLGRMKFLFHGSLEIGLSAPYNDQLLLNRSQACEESANMTGVYFNNIAERSGNLEIGQFQNLQLIQRDDTDELISFVLTNDPTASVPFESPPDVLLAKE